MRRKRSVLATLLTFPLLSVMGFAQSFSTAASWESLRPGKTTESEIIQRYGQEGMRYVVMRFDFDAFKEWRSKIVQGQIKQPPGYSFEYWPVLKQNYITGYEGPLGEAQRFTVTFWPDGTLRAAEWTYEDRKRWHSKTHEPWTVISLHEIKATLGTPTKIQKSINEAGIYRFTMTGFVLDVWFFGPGTDGGDLTVQLTESGSVPLK